MYGEPGNEEKPNLGADGEGKNKHKEEGEGRRKLDEADRRKIGTELDKYIVTPSTSNILEYI